MGLNNQLLTYIPANKMSYIYKKSSEVYPKLKKAGS